MHFVADDGGEGEVHEDVARVVHLGHVGLLDGDGAELEEPRDVDGDAEDDDERERRPDGEGSRHTVADFADAQVSLDGEGDRGVDGGRHRDLHEGEDPGEDEGLIVAKTGRDVGQGRDRSRGQQVQEVKHRLEPEKKEVVGSEFQLVRATEDGQTEAVGNRAHDPNGEEGGTLVRVVIASGGRGPANVL